jgi:hypothetical protein
MIAIARNSSEEQANGTSVPATGKPVLGAN